MIGEGLKKLLKQLEKLALKAPNERGVPAVLRKEKQELMKGFAEKILYDCYVNSQDGMITRIEGLTGPSESCAFTVAEIINITGLKKEEVAAGLESFHLLNGKISHRNRDSDPDLVEYFINSNNVNSFNNLTRKKYGHDSSDQEVKMKN